MQHVSKSPRQHTLRKIQREIGCKGCCHTTVALHNRGNLATGEVGNTCNQWAGHLPVVHIGFQCETLFQRMSDLPTCRDANVPTASDCIKWSCSTGCRNVITINGHNEMDWWRDSVEGGICWLNERNRVKRCHRCGGRDTFERSQWKLLSIEWKVTMKCTGYLMKNSNKIPRDTFEK